MVTMVFPMVCVRPSPLRSIRRLRASFEGDESVSVPNQLAATIQRKHRTLKEEIETMGNDTMVEKLQDAANKKPANPFRLGQLIQSNGLQVLVKLETHALRWSWGLALGC